MILFFCNMLGCWWYLWCSIGNPCFAIFPVNGVTMKRSGSETSISLSPSLMVSGWLLLFLLVYSLEQSPHTGLQN